MRWQYNDGGRKAAGFKGDTGDCVVRAISIGNPELDYLDVYNELHARNKQFATGRSMAAKRVAKNSSVRAGIFKKVYEPYLFELGWIWEALMGIGTGCTTHMKEDELPNDTVIVRLSSHIACVDYGVLQDTYNCSRDGTRCVYGIWRRLSETTRREELGI